MFLIGTRYFAYRTYGVIKSVKDMFTGATEEAEIKSDSQQALN